MLKQTTHYHNVLWKQNLNSDGHQFHQYQQNKQFCIWNDIKTILNENGTYSNNHTTNKWKYIHVSNGKYKCNKISQNEENYRPVASHHGYHMTIHKDLYQELLRVFCVF